MVYVDPLLNHGWVLRGHNVKNCHMFADTLDELHEMADAIGMKRNWFQDKRVPHYDLTKVRRADAVKLGAIELNLRNAVITWRTVEGYGN
jgi:hypothetical protein